MSDSTTMPRQRNLTTMTEDAKRQHEYELRLREIEKWAAEHDGKINAKWEAQDAENQRCSDDRQKLRDHIDSNFGKVYSKLSSLETKVATFAGLAALIGSATVKYIFP